jgi:hypothetical protein
MCQARTVWFLLERPGLTAFFHSIPSLRFWICPVFLHLAVKCVNVSPIPPKFYEVWIYINLTAGIRVSGCRRPVRMQSAQDSAHIDGVASELAVHSGHSTQSEPETIEEVRRIPTEHLREEGN